MIKAFSGWLSVSRLCLIGAGSIAAGAIDLVYAIAFNSRAGIPAIVIPQSVASGLLGISAFHGGIATAAVGLLLHFGILFAAAAVYFAFSRKLNVLIARPAISGALFGLAIYMVMHVVVLPLSEAPKFKSTTASTISDLIVHIALIGPIIAFAAHRSYMRQVPELVRE
jgi:uncharacterized membrane protein YagU involved in acid resistance